MRRTNNWARASALKIFGGSSHPEMTKLIARKVGARVGEVVLGKFENRETQVELKECVRGQDIYVVQTAGGKNPNDNLMELLFLVNALRLAAASNIIVITPFFFYSKGDQKDGYRVPITSKLVGAMLKKAGATHLMMLDPHTPQVEGFFDLVVDMLKVEPLFCEWVRHHVVDWERCVVISPDEGGAKRSASLANDLLLDFAIVSNRNKKFDMDTTHFCVQQKKRRKKRSICSDTESVAMKDSSRSSCQDSNDVPASSRSSVFDPSDAIDREKSEEPQAEVDAKLPDLDPLNLNDHRPEADHSVQSEVVQSSVETQTEDCPAYNGGRCYHTKMSNGFNADRVKRSHRAIGHLSSPVFGQHAIIVDDMIDTGHTIGFCLDTLQKSGALSATILATHGVFSKSAIKTLESYGDFIKAVVVTNSIPQTRIVESGKLKDKFHVLDVSGLIAEFVRRHHYCESVSVLGRFMPIRDNYNMGNTSRRLAEKNAAAKKSVEVEATNGATANVSDAAATKPVKDEVLENCDGEENDVFGDVDDAEDDNAADENGETVDDEDNSISLDELESARRDILDPKKHQKLRKGFRMASICWDD